MYLEFGMKDALADFAPLISILNIHELESAGGRERERVGRWGGGEKLHLYTKVGAEIECERDEQIFGALCARVAVNSIFSICLFVAPLSI